MKSKPKLLNQTEYAKHRGITKGMVSRLVKQGKITLIKKGKQNLINPKDADKSIEDFSDPARDAYRKGVQGKRKGPTYADAQTFKEILRGKILELEYKEKEGILIDARETERQLAILFTTIKIRIRAIAPKCAQKLAHLKAGKGRGFTAKVQEILRKECDEALEGLSGWKHD